MTAIQKVDSMMPNAPPEMTAEHALSLVRVVEKQGVENIVSIGMGFGGVFFVNANGMYIGIEKDGYAHT